MQIVSLWSLSIGVQTIFTTNELVDRIRNLEMKCIPEWLRTGFFMKRMCRRPDFLWKKMRRRQDLSHKMRRRPDFLTNSSWALCPVNAVRKLFSTNLSSESSSFNKFIDKLINLWPAYSTFVFPTDGVRFFLCEFFNYTFPPLTVHVLFFGLYPATPRPVGKTNVP